MTTPTLSIVAVFFNMRREAQRTLLSLSRRYQVGVARLDYEVICVDNGSTAPLDDATVRAFGPEFRHHFFETTSKSPAAAANFGIRQARAAHVMVILDGAHILTPRILAYAALCIGNFPSPLVAVQSLALAPANRAELPSWNQAAEDRRLAAVDWPRNGYELFRLTSGYGDESRGWFGAPFESACLTLRTDAFETLGGFDERFQSPGGGLVALDFFERALAPPELNFVMLLGESTFHQYHGGATTGEPAAGVPWWQQFHDEYRAIRGQDFHGAARLPIYFGQFTPQALLIAEFSARHGFAFWRKLFAGGDV